MITPLKIFIRESIIKGKEKRLSQRSGTLKKNSMMILRTDDIGDYVLFRNFLRVIRDSKKFRNFRIALCGNLSWKELAEEYDSGCVDEFIWIDKSKFLKRAEWVYTYKILEEIHSMGFELLIDPNPLKTYVSEYVKKYSGVNKIIENDPVDLRDFAKKLEALIVRKRAAEEKVLLEDFFQFYSNRRFVDSITESVSGLKRTEIETKGIPKSREYIVLFPGAGAISRIWSPKRFAELCRLIRSAYSLPIFICGDSRDHENANMIIRQAAISDIENMTGKTPLPQLVNLIANSELLISNETCAVHIAAAVGTRTVCLSNGNHFGRFTPYPKSLADNIMTIYPPEISERVNEYEKLIVEYAISSSVDINKITAEHVFNAVASQLNGAILQKEQDIS